MKQIILNAQPRVKKTKKFREEGFIPGVIYGDTVEKADPVKFEEIPLKRILAQNGSNAKLCVKMGKSKSFGVIKEIQRNPVSNKIIHIDVQVASKDHEIKDQVLITFTGESILRAKQLQLQINKAQVDVVGRIDLIPEAISVDVSKKDLGDTITLKDLKLDKQLKVSGKKDEIYASITKSEIEEVEEETEE